MLLFKSILTTCRPLLVLSIRYDRRGFYQAADSAWRLLQSSEGLQGPPRSVQDKVCLGYYNYFRRPTSRKVRHPAWVYHSSGIFHMHHISEPQCRQEALPHLPTYLSMKLNCELPFLPTLYNIRQGWMEGNGRQNALRRSRRSCWSICVTMSCRSYPPVYGDRLDPPNKQVAWSHL